MARFGGIPVDDAAAPAGGRFGGIPEGAAPVGGGALDAVKKGLRAAGDAATAVVTGSGEGASATEAGVGTFLQAPAANTLAGVLGARALADRGVTAALNYVSPGAASLNQGYQAAAQQASDFAAEQRAENLAAGNPLAKVGAAMESDGRKRGEVMRDVAAQWSPELVRQQKDQSGREGFVDSLVGVAENPLAFTHTMSRSAPDMVLGVGAAKMAAKGVAAAGGSAARQVGAASAAGVAAESASSANQARESVHQQVAGMPFDRLAASPRFNEILLEVGDPARARAMLANELADQAPLLAGAGTALGSAVANRLFGGDTAAQMIAGAERTTAKQAVKNVAQEGVEEGLQGVPEDLAQHGAIVQADRDKKFDLGKTLAENMAAGVAMGGVGSGMAYARDNWRRNGAAQPGSPDAAVSADQVLGADQAPGAEHSPFANGEQPRLTEAEKALYEPKMLTALDRVAEIDATLRTAEPEQAARLQVEREGLVGTWPKAAPGAQASFTTEAGARIDGQYALMEAGDLITSHDESLRQNALYPQELQPRERDRAASEMQVSGIVQKLDPARLGLSADASTGAPIVGADGLVESGNARTIALKRVYQANGLKADGYKQFLRDNAAQFGISQESVDAMQKPVLVRVRSTPVNRAEFARQANASTVAQMSTSEQAKSDAARLEVMDDLRPDDNGDFATSRDFIRRFMARLPTTEQAGMIDAGGNLSQAGYARIRNAVLAKAYGDSPVLARMVESMDDQLRNVGKALIQAAPEVAKMRQDVAEGALFDADIAPDLMAAVEELSRLRESGRSVRDALAQAGLLGEKYSPEARELLQFLDANIRRPRAMAEFILRYTEALRAAGNPNQGSIFGDATAPTKGQLLTAAKGNENAAEDAQRADAGKDEGPGGQGAGQPADARSGEGGAQGDESAKSEWVRFPAETGTLGIPRSEMPQVKGEHRGAMIQFLQGRGVSHETLEIPAGRLKPTQAEFSTKKTESWKGVREGVDRSVLISSDGYILDGHHQWVAALATSEPVKAIRFSAPIRELLATVHQFPSVKRSEGLTSDPKRAKAREDFHAALADLGAVLRDFAHAARMVPEKTPEFMPTLVKLSEATIKLVGYNIRDVVAAVKKAAKADAALKTVWNKITDEIYRKAAKQAVDNIFAHPEQSFGQGDLFSQPAKQEAAKGQTGDLFSAMAAAAPDVFKAPVGRSFDAGRDNWKWPKPETFLPAETVERAKRLVEEFGKEKVDPVISDEDRKEAERILGPMIAKAENAFPAYAQAIIDMAQSLKLDFMVGPVKKMDRAVLKLVADPDLGRDEKGNFQPQKVRDILRSTIVVADYADAQRVIDEIYKRFEVVKGRIKNRTNVQVTARDWDGKSGFLKSGYGDILLNVWMDGIQTEIQINTPEMIGAKQEEGHKLYEIERYTPKGTDLFNRVVAAQEEYYSTASRAASLRKSASDRGIGSENGYLDAIGNSESPDSLNALSSGNTTKNVPLSLSKNSQPAGNFSGTGIISSTSSDSIAKRDGFTLQRIDQKTRKLAGVTFVRGEYVSAHLNNKKSVEGEIVGISHARREVRLSSGDQWFEFGRIYKAERPAPAQRPGAVPLSSVIEKVNKKSGEGLTDADRVPLGQQSALQQSPVDAHYELMQRLRDGAVTLPEYRSGFNALRAGAGAIREELSRKTKDRLLDLGGAMFKYRYKSDKKERVVDGLYSDMVSDFALGRSYSYGMGKDAASQAVAALVARTDEAFLADYAARWKVADEVAAKRAEEAREGMEDPKTIADFHNIVRARKAQGMTSAEARMTLTPAQRAAFDTLTAEQTREARQARREAAKPAVSVAAQTASGEVIETKHTKTGAPLFVVKAAERVERDVYNQWNASAKRLGGWYSSFRGNGAVPGFQFKSREAADAFVQYLGGDTTAAREVAQERRDAFAEDRGQSASERLREMADRLEERADESLGRERKSNTERRARFAASAEASAGSDKALAKTMRNIAQAIEDGSARFLDLVRQKVQVEMLRDIVRGAKDSEIRARHPSYADQQKHRGEPASAETADYAEFPSYTAYRSDLARLARQMMAREGARKMGADLLKLADDVTAAYTDFARKNLAAVSSFSRSDGSAADFKSRANAEAAIARGGFRGKAVVLQIKRGQHRIVMSPGEAKERGVWSGDDDKRIVLSGDAGDALVAKVRELGGQALALPWVFERVATYRKRLATMGIESPAEFRSALREFIGLQEETKAPDRIKQMERAMIGRRNDGLDFFPTPAETAQAMVEAAGVEEGMSVLEPSAGMGHIAEQIRAAGIEPEVVEFAADRRELLGAKGFNVVGEDFMDLVNAEYDRIIMNPPFSERRDAEHVRHAYTLLKPGGRLVAIVGEGVFYGQDKKAQAFREWLESVGGTSEKLAEGTFMDPSLPVNTATNARMVVIDKPLPRIMLSRAGPASDGLDFAQEFLAELSFEDAAFRYPVSQSRTLEGNLMAALPGVEFLGEDTRPDEAEESGADRRYVFAMPQRDQRLFYVYTKGPQVWIDVSRLRPGDSGSAVYHGVANYAYNTGKVFVGDPHGLSEDAVIRRTANMLSSALRFGTTQHLEAAPEQIRGIPAKGVTPLDWRGSDLDKTKALIHTFVETLRNQYPSIDDYEYDFSRLRFRRKVDDRRGLREPRGRAVGREAVGGVDGGREAGEPGAPGKGSATVRRGIFLSSLMAAEGGKRPGILEQVLRRSSEFVGPGGLDGVLSRAPAADGFASGMAARDLKAVVSRVSAGFKNLPQVHVFESPAQAPKALRDYIEQAGATDTVEGAMHDGEIYLFASGLADEARAEHVLATHEITHYGLRGVVGKGLDAALQQVWMLNPSVRREANVLREQFGITSNVEAVEEILAEMKSEDLAKLAGWRRVVKVVRDWLRRAGAVKLADRLDAWMTSGLDDQQRADLFVADLVTAARDWVRNGKRPADGVFGMAGTRLADVTPSEDVANKQEKWLTKEAKARGYSDIEDLLARDYQLSEKLAELWRKKNPVEEALLSRGKPDIRMSRSAPSGGATAKTAAERADAIIAKPAGTRRPIDTIARALTQAVGLDSLTRKAYAKAGAIIDRWTPEQIKAGVVADYGIPEAVIDRRVMMQGAMKQQIRKSGELIEKLATLTREESRVAYEWMNNADPQAAAYFEVQLPPESVKVMAEVKRLVDDLSKEAVRLGQLSPDAFERNRFEYLHRSYIKHTAELTKGETEGRRRAIAVLGDQYKGRGMADAVDMAKFKAVAPEWWGRKLQEGKADKGLKGEKFIRLERRQPVGEGTRPLEEAQGPGEVNPLRKGKLLEVAYWPAGEKIPAKFSTWDQAGTWEVRDTKGGKLVVWRDFSKAEREAMGEIDEARYAIAKTLHGMIHDIETGRYLEWLAQRYAKKEGESVDGEIVEASESMRSTFAPGMWVRVPETKVNGTAVLKYGALAGRYLPGPIWNDVRQTVGFRFKPLGETYAAILSAWKTAKTALSPAVHTNNVMANMIMADWHDITAGHMVKALRVLLAAHERDGKGALGRAGNLAARAGIADREAAREILNRFQDSGGNLGTWAAMELQREQLEPLLRALENEIGIAGQTPGAQVGAAVALQKLLQLKLPSAWDAFKPTKAGQALTTEAGNLIGLYEAEDQVFRLAAWLKAKEEGVGDLAAGKVARRSFLDYHINAPWIQAARGTVFPFAAFTYRAVPMMLDIIAHKPWKLMKLAAIAGGLNWLGYLLSGGDEDDERRLLPEEKAGRIWGAVPKLIRMPWNDAHGAPVFLDVRRFVPVGDIFDTGATHTALPVMPAMVPGGPLAVVAELVINKAQFTGRAITLETDTATEKAGKVADHLYKAFAPNLIVLPGTYAWTGAANAATGRTDTFGREQSTAQAVASSFGVKLGSYPRDVLALNAQREAQAKMMEIDRNMTQLKREVIRSGISQDEFREKTDAQIAKKRSVIEALSEKM